MNIHEYQAKELLARYGVPVLRGGFAPTPDEAVAVARQLGGSTFVVKAQIHAGGRGKKRFVGDASGKGGVRVVKSLDAVRAEAAAMLGAALVTLQTGPQGKQVNGLYIEEGCDIKRELYLSLLVDRKTARLTVVASTEGGMSIEEVAA
jgi:succinyl-CoA synthetase beta subunit